MAEKLVNRGDEDVGELEEPQKNSTIDTIEKVDTFSMNNLFAARTAWVREKKKASVRNLLSRHKDIENLVRLRKDERSKAQAKVGFRRSMTLDLAR